MWVDADDLRSDIQTKITEIEGRGRTLNATEVGKIMLDRLETHCEGGTKGEEQREIQRRNH